MTFRDGTIGTVANATAGSIDATAVNGGTVTLSATDNIVVTGDGAVLGFATANYDDCQGHHDAVFAERAHGDGCQQHDPAR